jgi:hypothetical protein
MPADPLALLQDCGCNSCTQLFNQTMILTYLPLQKKVCFYTNSPQIVLTMTGTNPVQVTVTTSSAGTNTQCVVTYQ